MNKLLTTLFALAVASVTGLALAQAPAAAPAASAAAAAPAASAKAAAPAPMGAKSLEAKTAMCFGCHNIKGYQASFPEVHKVPMIAGQSAKYIVSALKAYKAGDRKHPTMRGIATTLSEQDMNDIAAFYEGLGSDGAKLPEAASKSPDPQVAALLQKAACVSCHGSNFSKPIDVYPKIAGQHPDYLFVALKAYKADANRAVGRSNGVMGAIAKQFSNDELKALAKYVGSLDGELKVVPEHRFRH
ncbi:c-type cytochrome [Caenimonas aquaedulcis]|uniref:C-type cytochrome n=1 Tax=Caenimonas aquaedulcis TaxID=2793270 RepID=A0A931H6M1_9BURK|nr:c-type cytochrome [Caenimonas aquaedulcis]MBG9389503.1 c-type cytochrome [Caenimonas aquaedulcis]